MSPADARNVLENEIKKDRGGSEGLADSPGDQQGEAEKAEDPHISSPLNSDDGDFLSSSGQAKPLPEKTTLWKVNIKFPIGVSKHFCLFKYLPPSTTLHNDPPAPAKKTFAKKILKCVKPLQ